MAHVQVSQLLSKQAMFGGAMAGMMGGVGAGTGSQGQFGGGRFTAMLKKTANAMRVSGNGSKCMLRRAAPQHAAHH